MECTAGGADGHDLRRQVVLSGFARVQMNSMTFSMTSACDDLRSWSAGEFPRAPSSKSFRKHHRDASLSDAG